MTGSGSSGSSSSGSGATTPPTSGGADASVGDAGTGLPVEDAGIDGASAADAAGDANAEGGGDSGDDASTSADAGTTADGGWPWHWPWWPRALSLAFSGSGYGRRAQAYDCTPSTASA